MMHTCNKMTDAIRKLTAPAPKCVSAISNNVFEKEYELNNGLCELKTYHTISCIRQFDCHIEHS